MRGVDAIMTNEEAKLVLLAIDHEFAVVTADELNIKASDIVWAYSTGRMARIDGEFSADDLEAIARWMRDPEGVANA